MRFFTLFTSAMEHDKCCTVQPSHISDEVKIQAARWAFGWNRNISLSSFFDRSAGDKAKTRRETCATSHGQLDLYQVIRGHPFLLDPWSEAYSLALLLFLFCKSCIFRRSAKFQKKKMADRKKSLLPCQCLALNST